MLRRDQRDPVLRRGPFSFSFSLSLSLSLSFFFFSFFFAFPIVNSCTSLLKREAKSSEQWAVSNGQ